MQLLRGSTQIYSGGIITTFSDTGLPPDSSNTYTIITSNSNGSAATSYSYTVNTSNDNGTSSGPMSRVRKSRARRN
jgi:hypothetical protein